MPDSFDYTTGTNSENVRLLQALIDDAPEYTEETNSRNANILKSIINNTEYTDAPQSEIEELLLRLKAKIGGEIEVDELNVTENGTYDAGVNKAYNPVKVELPLDGKTITENGTYTASDDNLAGYDEVTVAVEGYAKKSISNTPTPIATFNASALPMPSLTVGIEATQDLHGYDSPWVGGSGKNKFKDDLYYDRTLNGVTFARQADGGIKITGTATQNFRFNYSNTVELKTGQYILSGGATKIEVALQGFGYVTTTEKSITVESDSTYEAWLYLYGDTAYNTIIYPMLRPSNTDSTFEPYENICPISGWSAVNVTRTGKNLCKSTVHGYVSSSDDLIVIDNDNESAIFYAHEGQTYTISSSATMNKSRVALVGTDNVVNYTPILQREILSDNVNTWTATWTGWTVWYKCSSRQTAFDNSTQVELGSTATTYEPYNGHTYTTQLKDGQGNPMTCYGGTLDVVNGVLTVDRECVTYDGSENWILYGSGSASAFAMVVDSTQYNMNVDTTPITNSLKSVPRSATWGDYDDFVSYNNIRQIVCGIKTITTPEAWKTYLASNNLQVMYELATPQTIQLTPTMVKSLLGTNNLWADSGDIQSGEYLEAL